MAITVTINKYAEGRSTVPSTQGGNGTDLISTATETWYGTVPIVNAGSALEDSEGDIKTFAASLPTSITKVGTRYLNTIYWKEEGTAYLSEAPTGWEYNGTKNIIINLYYGKTSGSTNYKPSADELAPVTPPAPTSWNLTVNVKKDNSTTKNLNVTHYGSVGVSTSTMKVTYYTDSANTSQKVHTIDLPAGYKISSVTVNNNSISSEQTFSKQDVTVQYTLVKDEYTVTLDNRNATTTGTTSVTATYGFAMPSATMPQKTGYTFGGYYSGTNGSGTQYYKADGTSARSWDIRSNTTLYAKWTGNKYTVTLNNQSATTAGTSSVTATYGTAMPSATMPQKTGYTFGGYYTGTNGSGTQYYKADGLSARFWDKTTATTLYAKWTAKTATITWNANGGTCTTTSSSYTYDGDTVSLPTPSRTGYTFNGWYTAATGGTKITEIGKTNKPTANVTYYAQWSIISYTINYYIDGVKDTSLGNPATYTVETSTITLKNPTKSNYTGTGWRLNSTSGAQYTQIVKGSTGNKTFYWTWTPDSYTITYKDQGNKTFSGTHASGYPTTHTYGTATTLKTPTKRGYTFGGWFTSSDCSGTALTSLAATDYIANITLYAKWTAKTVTITWNPNGGSVSPTSSSYTYDGTAVTLPTPTRTGYTFKGWYTATSGGLKISDIGNTTKPVANITYYAQWTANSYTITYKDKGGSTFSGTHVSGYPTKHTYGTATTLKTASKTGYTFGGWFTSSDCSGTALTSLSATGYTSNITLYAKWTAINYTITYNVNGGNSIAQKTYTIETATFNLPEPTRDGYTFKGWYSNGSFSGSTTTQIAKGSTGDRTYYAKWEGNACTISVNANPSYLSGYVSGGKSCKVGDSVTLSASTPGGYIVFNSWTYGNTFISSSNPYTFNAPGTRTYTGNFTDYRQKITFKFHVNPQHYTDTPDSIVDILYGDTRTELSEVKRTRNGSNIVYEFDSITSTDVTVNRYAGGSGTYLSSINNSLNSQDMYILPSSLGGNNLVGIYIGKTPTSDSENYKENELVLDVYYGKLPSFSTPGGGSGSSIPSKQLKVRFNYWLEGVKLEKGTATWESKWGGYTPPEEIETWWIQYNGFEQDKKDYNKNRIHFTHHEIGDYNYNNITNTPTQIQEKLEIQAPINCYVDSVTGFDNNDLSKEYNTLTNTSGILDVDINYKNVTYLARATSNDTSRGNASVNGSGTNGSSDVAFIIGQQLTFNASPKTGYKFTKWVNKNNTSQEYTTNPYIIENAPATNVHYEAYFGPIEYTITLNPNGGSGSQLGVKIDYYSTSTKSTIKNPTRTGYTFNGWYTASSGGYLVIGTDGKLKSNVSGYTDSSSRWIKASNTTLYAQWTAKTITITWNPNGGSVSPTTSSYIYDGATVSLPTPTRTGYTFDGWYTAATSGTKIIGIGGSNTKPSDNVTYYAHWIANSYTIIYKDQGNKTFSGTHDSGYPTKHTYGTKTTLKTATKTGYTFGGWFTSSDCSGTALTSLSAAGITSNIILYAKWTTISYTITYHINGGTCTNTPSSYTIETADFNLPTPTKSGYTFIGWYDNDSFTGTPITKITKGSTGDKSYYAKWEGNPCTITVNANPSELTSRLTGGGNYRTGDSITITAPSEYDVYKFKNWTKNNSVVSTSTSYNFTANGNATYVANFIDNRKSALFKIHILDDSYNETGLCNVEIKYGNLDNPSENSIKRTDDRTIEIEGTTSICSVTKTHISGTNFSDKVNGTLLSQVFYAFPESINNEPFINILYNGNVIENEYSYTNNSLEFDVYYGNLPKNESGGGSGEPGDSDNSEITVRFKYYLDGEEIDTSNAAYISWPSNNIDELKCYWFKYDSYTKNDREIAITGITDRIQFSYVDTYWGDPAKSDPYSNLKNVLEIQAPSFTGLADSVYLTGVDIHDTNKTYTYSDCPANLLDICIYFESYEFNAYVYSNLPEYGDAYIAHKGTTNIVFHASAVAPTAIRFDAEVLNDAYEFNRWVNYNDEDEVALSKNNPWTIQRPEARDYHIEAIFTGRQLNIALDPNDGTAHAWWQHVGIVAGTKRFKAVSFNSDEDIRKPSDRTGYEFLGWYTSETNNNGSGDLIIDKNGNLQANVPGWTTSDGLWIKGPTVDTSECYHNVIVYAKWKPIEYTITYTNLKGATNPTDNPSTYTIETPTITFAAPTKNLPRGYTWSKWNPSSITKGSTGNKTITAEWLTNKYTLTWNLNGGTVTTAGTCAPLNSTGTVSGQVDYLSNITAPIVSKNGYKFEGWSANGVDVITPASKMPDGNITYIAVYSIKTYKISVNSIPTLDKVYIKVNDILKGTSTTCTTNDKITLIAENTDEYLLSYWQKSGGNVVSGQNEFTFTANDTYLDDTVENNIFTAYYNQDPRATLKINFIVDDFIEKTAIFKFNETFSFLGDSSTEGYRCEIQGEEECIEGDISINQGYFFIPSKYNGEDLCMVPHEQGSGTSKLICSNKGNTIGYDGHNSQYYEDNTVKNKYCPVEFEWQAYLPTNVADETHLVFPAVEKDEYGILYGPLVIDVYYGEIPERFLPVIPEDVEITTVSGLTLLQRIQNKIATFKWLNNLFGEPEKTTWDSYDNSGLKSFLKDDSKETPSSMHCIEYGDLQIYNQDTGNENINLDKTIKQYSLTVDKIIKPLNGQVELNVSKIEGNKIYFNISNLSGFTNTSNGIYIYFSVNNETGENNATLYKMKLPKTPSNKGLLLTIPNVSNIESLYIYRTPIMVDSTKIGIIPKILFSSEKEELPISVYDRTTLNTVI